VETVCSRRDRRRVRARRLGGALVWILTFGGPVWPLDGGQPAVTLVDRQRAGAIVKVDVARHPSGTPTENDRECLAASIERAALAAGARARIDLLSARIR
jgi:hypothetical protein